MKSEATLIAIARNLISKGYSEEDARNDLVERYPEDEGTILTMVIQDSIPEVDHQIETLATLQILGVETPVEIVEAPAPTKADFLPPAPTMTVEDVLAQPFGFQAEVLAALLKVLPAPLTTIKPTKIALPVKVKTGGTLTKTGRARALFLAAEDRSAKALSDLFMQEIGWVRGDANYYAKQITAEFEAGKLQ